MIVFKSEDIVKKYLGIPYKHLGRGMDGLDCWGFVVNVYRDYGVEVLDLQDYEKEWARRGQDLILGNYYKNWKEVTCFAPGDLILLTYPRGVVGHAGICLDRGIFIHATRSGIQTSRIKDWKDKIHSFYRWQNIKE